MSVSTLKPWMFHIMSEKGSIYSAVINISGKIMSIITFLEVLSQFLSLI